MEGLRLFHPQARLTEHQGSVFRRTQAELVAVMKRLTAFPCKVSLTKWGQLVSLRAVRHPKPQRVASGSLWAPVHTARSSSQPLFLVLPRDPRARPSHMRAGNFSSFRSALRHAAENAESRSGLALVARQPTVTMPVRCWCAVVFWPAA